MSVKKLASQTAVYGLTSMARLVYSMLLVPLQTSVCSRAEYGEVSNLYAYIPFFTAILTLGFETAFFRFSTSGKNEKDVFKTGSLMMIIFSVLFLTGGIFYSLIFKSSNLQIILIYFSFILFFDTLCTLPFARLRLLNKAKIFAAVRMGNIFLTIFLNYFFLWYVPINHVQLPQIISGLGNVEYIFISNLLASALQFILLFPALFFSGGNFDSVLLKKMLKYGTPMIIVGLAGTVNETFDRAIMPYLLEDKTTSMEQLGIYGACYKISIFMTLFVQAFRTAAEPYFFSHSQNSDSKQIYARTLNWFTAMCGFIFLVIMMYLDTVKLYIDEKFWDGLFIVPILLLANIFLGIYYNISVWYKLTDNTKIGSYISLGGAALTLLLLYLWIPVFGYAGAAWATLFCYFSMAVAGYFTGKKYFPVPYNIFKIIGCIAVAILLYFLFSNSFMSTENFVFTHVLRVAFILLYIVFVYFTIYKMEDKNSTI